MHTERLLGLADVLAQTSLGQTSLYKLLKAGKFPQPVPLDVRRKAWREQEVQEWIAQRIAQRDAKRARAELKSL